MKLAVEDALPLARADPEALTRAVLNLLDGGEVEVESRVGDGSTFHLLVRTAGEMAP